MSTLYASFVDAPAAEKAAAALLDHGARAEDISILANNESPGIRSSEDRAEAAISEQTAKSGITTTTAADAGLGAAKGTMVGLGIGIAAALAAVFVPGIGLILGGGALATAVAGAAASAGAGAIAGGVAGYLKDQGMGEELATHYSEAFAAGGAVLAVDIPTGDLSGEEIEPYLVKYGAINVSTVHQTRNLMSRSGDLDFQPVDPSLSTPAVVPVAIAPVAVPPVGANLTSMTTVPAGPAVTEVDVVPTVVSPVTGAMQQGVVVAPDAAAVHATPVVVNPLANEPAVSPVSGFTLRDVTPVESDPVTGQVVRGYVTDPVTGGQRPVRIVNGSIVYVDQPVTGP
ncbi:MAG: hypothetical protein ACO1SV_16305 [Fimbriimonas sp.]